MQTGADGSFVEARTLSDTTRTLFHDDELSRPMSTTSAHPNKHGAIVITALRDEYQAVRAYVTNLTEVEIGMCLIV
jgi:hypothetical protein